MSRADTIGRRGGVPSTPHVRGDPPKGSSYKEADVLTELQPGSLEAELIDDGRENEAGDNLVSRLIVGICVDKVEICVLARGCLLDAIE